MNVYDMIDSIATLALKKGEERMGERCYAYAFGMMVAEIQADLDEMGLTKTQLKVLEKRIERLQKIVK